MPLARPLSDIQRELLQLLTEDLKAVLENLQALLPENTRKQDEIFLLLGRYNDARRLDQQGVAPNEEIRRLENQVRRDLLAFINDLTEADFDPDAQKNKPGSAKQGMLLYQVPHLMTLEEETRCTVRIALDRDVLFDDLKIIDHTEERLLKKISKTMQVELGDPSGGRNFSIRSTSKAVQTIDLDGVEYTEWRFYVTPLREGQYILEVKVAVIELVDGEKELRERVLEEEVRIVSGSAGVSSAAETPFKPSGEALAFAPAANLSSVEASNVYIPYIEGDNIPSINPKTQGGRGLRTLAFFLAFLIFGTVTTWAITPAETLDWWKTRYLQDTPEAYEAFIQKYEHGRHREKAMYRKAVKTEAPQDIRQYLNKYAQGEYVPELQQLRNKVEIEHLNVVQQNPNTASVRQFMRDFPESERLPELKKAVESRPDLALVLLPEIEKAETQVVETRTMSAAERQVWEDALQQNTAKAFADFVTQYPKSVKRDEARQKVRELKPTMVPQEQAWADAYALNTPLAYIYFVEKYPKSAQAAEARQRIKMFSLSVKEQIRMEAEAAARVQAEQEAERQRMEQEEAQRKAHEAENQKQTTSETKPENRNQRSGLDMVRVSGGTFTMGFDNEDASYDEKPPHSVTVSSFSIGRYEVTQGDWRAVMGENPSVFKDCNECAVEQVSWNDIQYFIKKLNNKTGKKYRLPTEAEWEYAARGGVKTKGFKYSGSNNVGEVAWYTSNSDAKTHRVGEKAGNELGLHDMNGNVSEWCSDWYDDYSSVAQTDPSGPKSGEYRVYRGGSWNTYAENCRATARYIDRPARRNYGIGFRLAIQL